MFGSNFITNCTITEIWNMDSNLFYGPIKGDDTSRIC